MAEPLWQWDELSAAAGARIEGTPSNPVTGFSIDTRTINPGDVFVALKDARDGHEFVGQAFKAGAAAAIVAQGYARQPGDGALLRVDDPLRALEGVGRAARIRADAKIVAVTGSVGKTGTKEALRLCLSVLGATHASEKSYNNHWGVPLTLARLPKSAQYGVFEIGMNHAGEITPLTQMVRPHVAVITTVEPVHLAQFQSVEEIAEAKAEILQGLVPGGTAVLPRDNSHFPLLHDHAMRIGARLLTFGYHDEADFRCVQVDLGPKGSSVIAGQGSQRFPYKVGAPGEHFVRNSLAVLATLRALGADIMKALPALASVSAATGRGARTLLGEPDAHVLLIDESYNANPASMRAALAAMATTPREEFPRRIAVLGDMLELGNAAEALHRSLKEAVDAAGTDLVFACGPNMKLLMDDLAPVRRGSWAASSAELTDALLEAVRPGDVVMIKGSLGSRMAPLVAAMLARFGKPPGGS
jgi:UDP-N-acetylmuramoyl-tripeptide--D-alanyl-D-alanine ligase